MPKQADIFLAGEGAAWLARNRDKIEARYADPVCDVLVDERIAPKRVLEVGCANGWRLKELHRLFKCEVFGIDPAGISERNIIRGDTRHLRAFAFDAPFDLIIFGFCLYLVDREDLFNVVTQTDSLLADGGHLVIHDFLVTPQPYARPYVHCPGVLSYHMDHAALWKAHPHYRHLLSDYPESDEQIDLLRKDVGNAFPVVP